MTQSGSPDLLSATVGCLLLSANVRSAWILLKKSASNSTPEKYRLRLKSEFLAEGSVFGFHVTARNRGVFIHQYSSVLGEPTFSTQSVESTL
jgi:hypothetical protein